MVPKRIVTWVEFLPLKHHDTPSVMQIVGHQGFRSAPPPVDSPVIVDSSSALPDNFSITDISDTHVG
jgi:hypothetical protein